MAVASSCSTSNIVGSYNRTYKISAAAMTSVKKQKLIINADSSFMWTDYKDEFSKIDSSLTYGIIKSTNGNKLYVLKDTVTNNKFCLFNKGGKLYFYDCSQGKKYRYSNPFIKENHN
ncbi:MAG: hypothetical protein ABIN67_07125 [Ferruginibacter sp.]